MEALKPALSSAQIDDNLEHIHALHALANSHYQLRSPLSKPAAAVSRRVRIACHAMHQIGFPEAHRHTVLVLELIIAPRSKQEPVFSNLSLDINVAVPLPVEGSFSFISQFPAPLLHCGHAALVRQGPAQPIRSKKGTATGREKNPAFAWPCFYFSLCTASRRRRT